MGLQAFCLIPLAIAATILLSLTRPVAAGELSASASKATFHVLVNQRKESGHAWHGPGDLFVAGGKIATHLPEAPSAVLCIVTRGGKVACPGQREGAPQGQVDVDAETPAKPAKPGTPPTSGKPSPTDGVSKMAKRFGNKLQSPCPSAYDCSFEEIALPSDPIFGLVVVDQAMVFVNLVDAVIVTRRPMTQKDEEVIEFDKRLREAVKTLAPPGPFEAKRRLRKFQVRTLNECPDGCKFSQSELTFALP